jgi:hypothetical protein
MTEIPTPTQSIQVPTEKKRPTGITVLALIWIFFNIINLIGTPGSISLYGSVYAGYSVVTAIIGIILGIALWQMLPWARKAAIIWEIIGLLLSVVMAYLVGSLLGGVFFMAMFILMIPSAVVALIIIGYLMQGSIKAAFEEGTVAEAW